MGVFNILKRKRKEERLDIPPPPPIPRPIARVPSKLVLPNLKEVPKIPQPPKFKPLPVPKIPQPPKFKPVFPKKVSVPELPKFEPKPRFISRIAPRFAPEPKEAYKEPIFPKKTYLEAESFRDIMENINEVKNKIRESEDILTRLNEIKNREDKEFNKWHSKFEDVQRKLVYIDKTFFGG